MRYFLNTALLSFVALASGCATSGQLGRSINYDEASAFEKSLQAQEFPPPQMPERLYTQPVNQNVPCKLSTSKDQLARSNFRAYWDGQCKDGYAFGLGRDIAISDTHHVEEITIHNGNADYVNSPVVDYDFVNNVVEYRMVGKKFPEASVLREQITNTQNGFNVAYAFGTTDEGGNSLVTHVSPFNPMRTFLNVSNQVVYKFSDNSSMPVVNDSAIIFAAEILDAKTKSAGGVGIVRYGNGQVRHFLMKGTPPELVTLPVEYRSHLEEKYKAVLNAQKTANADIERVRQMEREYLYMACNGKHTIAGLDKEISTKICTWRDQFKAPYEKALAKYTQDIEQLKQQAEATKNQRKAQQQVALQQQQIEQQQSQRALQESINTLGQMGQQTQNSGQQMMQAVMSQPPPQLIPMTPLGGNQVNCVTVGSITTCR